MNKKFSIIIPAYNCEKYIDICIKSILTQNFKDYEIIVVDDCSNDKTYDLLKKYENIKVIRHDKNKKAGGARNTGLKVANGEYIMFLDADDYLANSTVLTDINKIIKEKGFPDLIYMGFQKVGKSEGVYIPDRESANLGVRLRTWKYQNVWDICWKKEFIEDSKLEFVEDRYYEDFVFYYEAILKAKSIAVAEFVTHIYTVYMEGNITSVNSVSIRKLKDTYFNLNIVLDLIEKTPKEYRKDMIDSVSTVIEYSLRLLKSADDISFE